jgi:hypothetical protein
LTVKSNQKILYRQIGCQFEENHKIPFTIKDVEKLHGCHTRWELRAKEAPEHIKAIWPGSSCTVEVITSTTGLIQSLFTGSALVVVAPLPGAP